MVRGPLSTTRLRPQRRSSRWIACSNCSGNRCVSASATRFRNHGCARRSCGSVSYTRDTRRIVNAGRRQRFERVVEMPLAVADIRAERQVNGVHLEERRLQAVAPAPRDAEIFERAFRAHAPARRAVDEAELDQIRLVDFFDGRRLLVNGRRDGVHAHRPATVFVQQREHDLLVDFVEPVAIHFQQIQRGLGDVFIDMAVGPHLRVITNTPQQPVGDARRATAAAGQLPRRPSSSMATSSRRAERSTMRLARLVVMVEPQHQAEASAQRRAHQPLARGGADGREARAATSSACARPARCR